MPNLNLPRLTAFAAAALIATGTAQANIVVNGDFETGTFSGWTKSGNASLSDVIANTATSNHSFLWRSGATGSPAYITQMLNTVVGTTYTLEFDLFVGGGTNNSFTAMFNGVTQYSSSNTSFDWTHFSFTGLTATSALTELQFGARNDPSFSRLDNVNVFATSVAAIPEPATWMLVFPALAIGAAAARRRKSA